MKNTTPIERIMTRKPATVGPADHLDTIRLIFEKQGFHHVPVVEDHKLVGIVSYTDYLRAIRDLYDQPQPSSVGGQLLKTITAADIMTADPVCLTPLDTVEDALQVFRTHQFHAVPVVEGPNRLVGIVSTFDLIRLLEKILGPELDYAGKA